MIPLLRRFAPVACLLCAGAAAACDGPVGGRLVVVPIEQLLREPVRLVLNPSGVSPLAALATVRSRGATTVRARLLNGDPFPREEVQPTTDHSVPILGLVPGVPNRVEVRVSNSAGEYGLDTLTLTPPALPDFFPTIDISHAESSTMEPGWTLAAFSEGVGDAFLSYPFMFDAQGRIRWYLDLSGLQNLVFTVEPLRNGNLLYGYGSSLHEIDLLGRELRRWDFPGYTFHHDVVEKPDGDFIVAVDEDGAPTVEDRILQISRVSGAITRVWDLRDVLDVHRRAPLGNNWDWFHNNSVWYDERDGSLLVSGRHQGVAKLSSDGALEWILAPHRGWGRAGSNGQGLDTSSFLLTAVDAKGLPYPEAVQLGDVRAPGFDWPWGQHAVKLLPNGNLLLFDNGDARNFSATPRFSRAVEYVVDPRARTVRQVWQYGEERGSDYFARIVSDVEFLPGTGNRLISPGIVFEDPLHAYVTEVAYPSGRVVFEAKLGFRNRRSSGAYQWGQFDLIYRAKRLDPYELAGAAPDGPGPQARY